MDPLTLGLIGGGLGLFKSLLIDKPREERDRRLAAETQKYSPWTHMQAGAIREANPLGDVLSYGTQGAALGQNLQNAASGKEMQGLYKKLLEQQINQAAIGTGAGTTFSDLLKDYRIG